MYWCRSPQAQFMHGVGRDFGSFKALPEPRIRPEMQRYCVLLVISWLLNFILFEPLLLILHLFVGEPSVDEPRAGGSKIDVSVCPEEDCERAPPPLGGTKGCWSATQSAQPHSIV